MCFNEVNNLICMLSPNGPDIAIYEGNIRENPNCPYRNMTKLTIAEEIVTLRERSGY